MLWGLKTCFWLLHITYPAWSVDAHVGPLAAKVSHGEDVGNIRNSSLALLFPLTESMLTSHRRIGRLTFPPRLLMCCRFERPRERNTRPLTPHVKSSLSFNTT